MKNPANKKRRPLKARSNHTFPDTLGKVVIVTRSIYGAREDRKYTRRKNRATGTFLPAAIPSGLLLALLQRTSSVKEAA